MNTDRIYQAEDDRWYFNVRGNLSKGPFTTYVEAEAALTRLVRQYAPSRSGTWPRMLKVFGDNGRSQPGHS